MKYRIKEVSCGKVSMFYPQFKSCIFWRHFRDFDPDVPDLKVCFRTYQDALRFIYEYKKRQDRHTVTRYYEVK